MQKESKYRKIIIQELQQRPQINGSDKSKDHLARSMNEFFKWSEKPVMCYADSGISKERIIKTNDLFKVSHFFNAFLFAYTQHGDVLLVPDQIWIMITFHLSTYINKHSEKLRKQLVNHTGKKTLTVYEAAHTKEESLLAQKNWDHFFEEIINLIEKQTVEGVVQGLACDFSTTDKTYKTISTAIIMGSLKKFFNYYEEICACGINNVYMAGVREDWEKMIPKLENLAQYDVDGQLKKYIKHIKVILENFLSTWDGKPDKDWWNLIMKTPEQQQIYGGESQRVQGWILHFYGIYEPTELDGFPEIGVKLPIHLINHITKKQKTLALVCDWASVSKMDERTYKPDVGLSVICKQTKALEAGTKMKATKNTEKVEEKKKTEPKSKEEEYTFKPIKIEDKLKPYLPKKTTVKKTK